MRARRQERPTNLRGYWTYASREAVQDWERIPVALRLAWIEEMIALEASLPARIRKAHQKCRERPAP